MNTFFKSITHERRRAALEPINVRLKNYLTFVSRTTHVRLKDYILKENLVINEYNSKKDDVKYSNKKFVNITMITFSF